MRRALLASLVMSLPLLAARSDSQAPTIDAVAWFLSEFELAFNTRGDNAAIATLVAPEPAMLAGNLVREIRGLNGADITVVARERDRRSSGTGFIVTTDVLVSRDQTARVATYDFTLRPTDTSANRLELTFYRRIAFLDGLYRLTLDVSKQFDIHHLEFTAPDLVLKMAGGTAFTASTDGGVTAIVLHGRGQLHFTPADAAEQDQLRIFSRQPALDVSVEDVFVRLNPADMEARLNAGSLVPVRTDLDAASRARAVFDRFLPRSYSLTLGDLSSGRWSMLPPPGNLAVEFRTPRFGWLTYARSVADPEDITLFDREHGKNISLYTSAEKVGRGGRFYDEDANAAYDVLHYDVDVKFDPARAALSGRGSIRLRALSEVAQSLSFRLAESLTVTSVTSPELGRLLPLRVAGQTTLLLTLPTAVRAGREFTIDVAYSGRAEPQDLGNEIVLPDYNGRPIESPESVQVPEPRFLYSHRSYWHPQGLHSDYATARMRLTVPAEFQTIATGLETSSFTSTTDGRLFRTTEYVADRPVRYLACQISRFTAIGHGSAGGVDIDVVAMPRVTGNTNRAAGLRAASVIDFFASRFGEAPYRKLTVGFGDALLPAGHSPAFFAFVQQPLPSTPYTWRQDPLALDGYPDFLLAHEVAHQWWGQAVGFKSYHDQWLSEGLAQYSAAMYVGRDHPDVERALIQKMRESAQSLSAQGPIYLGYRLGHIEGRGAAFRGVVYNKSAVVLHMLRRLIGDEPFKRGLQRFYRQWQFRKAGTDDLRMAFEAEAGRPLTRFFDRWILGSTLPQLRIRSTVDEAASEAAVEIEQIGPVFDLPVTVTLLYADGRTRDVTIPVTEASTRQRLPVDGRLRRIVTRDELTLAERVN